ncbi:hypothetical protein GCM10010082_06740 [Kushneria pakistanensis]|uniref:CRISPR-associated protein Cas2 n=1 Tax=Kushneria pakistanensis TaxID=1508770 RepID=A0ABQ3FC40_9GAMM|nr:hypothetical protein [Kushneria pakistanensis]GHC18075.1 hypothetical protein GCM10010082_06740 [Kushneria pakistanensis]
MADYMITCDLKRPGQEYRHLLRALALYPDSLHVLETTWLVRTTATPDRILADLEQYVDRDDQMFIATIQTPAAWSDSLGVNQVLQFFSHV